MPNDSSILLIAIIALLVVIVAVLLWAVLRYQRKISSKDDAIIRGIRETHLHQHHRHERSSRLRWRRLRPLKSPPALLMYIPATLGVHTCHSWCTYLPLVVYIPATRGVLKGCSYIMKKAARVYEECRPS